MFQGGLVSVSFRSKSPEELTERCSALGLQFVEWGTDVHVPTPKRAQEVRAYGRSRGVLPCSCGSYYKIGISPMEAFYEALAITKALDVRLLRIWAGNCGSSLLSESEYQHMVSLTQVLCREADKQGIDLCLECHPNTLTDRYEATLRFLEDVQHPRLKTYWQPNQNESLSYNMEAAEALAPYTRVIHVFHWSASERFPLSEGVEAWQKYLSVFRLCGGNYYALLEFMHDDRVESLPDAAKTLQELIR